MFGGFLTEPERTMYPALNKLEQSHDKPGGGSISIGLAEPSDSEAKLRLLELTLDSVRALKAFVNEFDQLTGERDQLQRQINDSVGELETLRTQVEQLKVQRDQFAGTLSTLTSQVEAAVRIMADVPAAAADPPAMPRAPSLAEFVANAVTGQKKSA